MLYLCDYIGAGTKLDPRRPLAFELAECGAVDMRPDPTRLEGRALVHTKVAINDPRIVQIADHKTEVLSALSRKRLYDRLKLVQRPARATAGHDLLDIFTAGHSGMCKPVKRVNGVAELWARGELIHADGPIQLPRFGTIIDNLARANETPLAGQYVQATGSGSQFNLSSGVLVKPGTADCAYWHNNSGLGWLNDQSAAALYVSFVPNDDWGPAVRITNGINCYLFSQYVGGAGFVKYVGGGYNNMGTGFVRAVTAQTPRCAITGTTLRAYVDATEDALSPQTDTSLSTGSPGLFWYESGGSIGTLTFTGELGGGGGGGGLVLPQMFQQQNVLLRM